MEGDYFILDFVSVETCVLKHPSRNTIWGTFSKNVKEPQVPWVVRKQLNGN